MSPFQALVASAVAGMLALAGCGNSESAEPTASSGATTTPDCPGFAERMVAVPDVVGLDLDEAIATVEAAGFQVVDHGVPPNDPIGPSAKVVAQEPGGGSEVPEGACIGFRTTTRT